MWTHYSTEGITVLSFRRKDLRFKKIIYYTRIEDVMIIGTALCMKIFMGLTVCQRLKFEKLQRL